METSDESFETGIRHNRASTTLDEIVSQYADIRPDSPYPTEVCDTGPPSYSSHPGFDTRANYSAENDPFSISAIRSNHADPEPTMDQGFESQEDEMAVCGANGQSEGNQERDEIPESSRRGLFTPSKLRFRLRKRKTTDTEESHVSNRRAASTWGPLSSPSASKKARSRMHFRWENGMAQRRGRGSSSQVCSHSYRGTKSIQSSPKISPAVERTERQLSRPVLNRESVIFPIPWNSGRPITNDHTSTSLQTSAKQDLTSSTSNIVPSSSLLPRLTVNNFPSSPPFPTNVTSLNDAPPATTSDLVFETSSQLTDRMNKDAKDSRDTVREANISGTSEHVDSNMEGPELIAVTSHMTRRAYRVAPQTNMDSSSDEVQNEEALLRLRLQAYDNDLNDRELSRFLRDSRFLRNGQNTKRPVLVSNHLSLQLRFHLTGSSLANISSDSNTFDYGSAAKLTTSGSYYSDDCDTAEAGPKPAPRGVQTVTGNSGAHTSEQATLGSPHVSASQFLIPCRHDPAILVCNEASISADIREVQRKAGALLLAFGALAYLPGGWVLIHSLGRGGPLATSAMADLTRVLLGSEKAVVSCVHPMDAATARAVERAAVASLVLGAVAWLAVAFWAATVM